MFDSIFHLNGLPPPDATGCDVNMTVTETKQYFATEGYPDGYKHNQDCDFNFIAPGKKNCGFLCRLPLESWTCLSVFA